MIVINNNSNKEHFFNWKIKYKQISNNNNNNNKGQNQ